MSQEALMADKRTPKNEDKKSELAKPELTEVDDDLLTDDPDNDYYYSMPGALRGESQLTLETRRAQLIFEGRKPDKANNKPMVIGLARFARLVRIIYDAHGKGDPYADFFLVKIERNIAEKNELFDKEINRYKKLLGQFENMNHEVAHSIKPIVKSLKLAIPYSYQVAMLLMRFDELVRYLLTAHHVGLLATTDRNREVKGLSKKMRNVMEMVNGYRFCDITRDDVIANNPKAQRAQEQMGACPSGILDDDVFPSFASSKALYLKSGREKLRRNDPNSDYFTARD